MRFSATTKGYLVEVGANEIEVLRGFDISRWRPQLILLEDHVADLSKHRYLVAAGYRTIRRYENCGWYVPREFLRKYYLALPFRALRNHLSRRVREGARH